MRSIPERKGVDAYCTFDTGEPTRITIDPDRVGIVRGVLHEMLHVILDDSLYGLDADLEETCIRAIEDELYAALQQGRQIEALSKAIQKRTAPPS